MATGQLREFSRAPLPHYPIVRYQQTPHSSSGSVSPKRPSLPMVLARDLNTHESRGFPTKAAKLASSVVEAQGVGDGVVCARIWRAVIWGFNGLCSNPHCLWTLPLASRREWGHVSWNRVSFRARRSGRRFGPGKPKTSPGPAAREACAWLIGLRFRRRKYGRLNGQN